MKRAKKIILENYVYFFSFLIPVLIFLVVFKESKIYPFGDYSYLANDALQQYEPMIKGFYNRILQGKSLEYTWNIGLGTGYGSIYAYYLASPLNWLLFILIPVFKINFVDIIDVILVLKVALCGLTFAYFIVKKYQKKSFLVIVVSICYALSAYVCNYGINIMWMDALVLLPVIILGLEALYKEGKHRMYTVSLFVAILSNYYIGIMLCIFVTLYFVALLIFDEHGIKKQNLVLRRLIEFVIYSAIAGFSTFAITLPAVYSLGNTSSGDFSFPKAIKFYNSILEYMVRPLIMAPKDIRDYFPNLYCSVIVLLVIPVYLMNGKIELKRKLKNVSLISIMLISFNINVLEYIWHGFHFPNCLSGRNSFLYVFLILMITYESIDRIKDLKDHFYISSIVIAVSYLLIIWKFVIGNEHFEVEYKEVIIYLSLFFIILYGVIGLILRGIKSRVNVVYFILLLIVIYEMYMNAGATIGSTMTRDYLISDNEKIQDLLITQRKEEKTKFYRTEKESYRTANDGEWDNYHGLTMFSSTANAGVVNFLHSLGMETFTNYYTFNGNTDITKSLFGIKYVLNDEMEKYPYAFSLGYMINSELENRIQIDSENSFENLNAISNSFVGKEMFHKIKVSSSGKFKKFKLEQNGRVFFKCSLSPYSIFVKITDLEGKETDISYSYQLYSYICDLGELKAGSEVEINIVDEDEKYDNFEIFAYSYDDTVIKECYEKASKSFFNIKKFQDTYVEGTIDVSESGQMLTTIPYDKGWSAYVDGKKVNIHLFKEAFVSVNLESGQHTVKFVYETPGRKLGIFISIAAISLYIILEIAGKRKKIRQQRIESL